MENNLDNIKKLMEEYEDLSTFIMKVLFLSKLKHF